MNRHQSSKYTGLIAASKAFLIQLRSKTGFKDFLKNSGWLFLDKAIRAVLGLLVGAWIARYLGPSDFGELSFYLAIIAIFQTITTLGMDGIVVREIAKSSDSASVTIGTVFWMRLLSGVICWVLVVLGFTLTEPDNSQEILILAIVGASLVFQASDVIDLWFQGKSQNKRGVYAKLSAYLIANALKISLIILGADLIAFAFAIAIEAAIITLAMFACYYFYPCSTSWGRNWKLGKTLVAESWPYLVSSLSIMIYMRIDQVMIKKMLGEYELGLFSAAIPFANIWNVVPVIICTVLMPYMARKKIESNREFDLYLIYLFRIFWIIAIVLVIFTNLTSHFLISNFYGDSYKEAVPILNIYILTIIPVFLGVAQNIWIVNEKKSGLVLIQTSAGAVFSICTNLALIPVFGLQGAAIAAVIAQFVSAILINLFLSKELFKMQLGINFKKY